MAYKTITRGAATFRTINIQCPECGYEEERSVDLRGLSDEERQLAENPEIKCPNCDHEFMQKVWRGAPSIGNYKNERSADTIAARKRSFQKKQRKDDDDVRHKFGRLYDDSLNSSAAQRIKKKLDKKNDGVDKK